MQKLSLIILLLLTAGLSCMAAEDWFTGFQEEMTGLQTIYIKGIQMDEKREEMIKRERAERRRERDNDDDDDDDDDNGDDNDRDRERRKQFNREKRQMNKDLDNTAKELFAKFDLFAELSGQLQKKLNKAGIGKAYHFGEYGEATAKAFKERKFDSDFSSEDFRVSRVLHPLTMFRLIQYELNCLIACQVDPDAPVPDQYLKYRTFLHFYNALCLYRAMTKDFTVAEDDYTNRTIIKQLAEELQNTGSALEKIVRKNNTAFAEVLRMKQFLDDLDKHTRIFVFQQKSMIDNFVGKDGSFKGSPKLSPAHQELVTRLERTVKTYFDPVGLELRGGEKIIVDFSRKNIKVPKKIKKPRRRGNARRKKDADALTAQCQYTAFFAEEFTSDPRTGTQTAETSPETDEKAEPAENEQSAAAGDETDETGSPSATVSNAEHKKFMDEVEAFRRDHVGTANLLANGLNTGKVPLLLQTMTPEIQSEFQSTAAKKMDNGIPETRAFAEAFLSVKMQERQKKYRPTEAHVEKVRAMMEQHNSGGSASAPAPAAAKPAPAAAKPAPAADGGEWE